MRKFIAFILLIFFACGTKPKTGTKGGEGSDFTLESITGEKISLTQQKGKVVLLDFWATWCPPCRAATPKLIEFYNKYKDQGFLVLGIGLDERNAVTQYAQEQKIPYPILFDDKTVSKNYGIQSIPTFFLIDRKGKSVNKIIGFSAEGFDALEKRIVELLKS